MIVPTESCSSTPGVSGTMHELHTWRVYSAASQSIGDDTTRTSAWFINRDMLPETRIFLPYGCGRSTACRACEMALYTFLQVPLRVKCSPFHWHPGAYLRSIKGAHTLSSLPFPSFSLSFPSYFIPSLYFLPPLPLEVSPHIAARGFVGALKLSQRVRAEPGRQTLFSAFYSEKCFW